MTYFLTFRHGWPHDGADACRTEAAAPFIEVGNLTAFLDAHEHTRFGNRDRFILVLRFDTIVSRKFLRRT